jgi:hypothetical protein
MTDRMTVPTMRSTVAENGIRYLIDSVPRPIEAKTQAWGDCAIRAMSLALGRDYLTLLNEVVRRQGRPVHDGKKSYGTETDVTTAILAEAGWTYAKERRKLNSAKALARLPRKAILHFNGHVAYIENGVIHDLFETQRDSDCRQTIGWWVPQNTTKIVTIQEVLARKKEPRRNLIVQYRADRDVLTSEADKALWDTIVASDLTEEEYALYINIYRKAA